MTTQPAATPPLVECFFDCSSPWTYLAFVNLRAMSAELGVPVQWRPILVGGLFNTVNPSVYAFREHGVPAKQAYARKDLADWARFQSLAIRVMPSRFPINSVKAMRACLWLAPHGLLAPFAQAVFEAYWGDDEDIADDAVLARIAQGLGIDAGQLLAGLALPEVKAALKANTDEVAARGGFGSPTVFVAGDDMYFGNDRLPLVRAAVQQRLAQLAAHRG